MTLLPSSHSGLTNTEAMLRANLAWPEAIRERIASWEFSPEVVEEMQRFADELDAINSLSN